MVDDYDITWNDVGEFVQALGLGDFTVGVGFGGEDRLTLVVMLAGDAYSAGNIPLGRLRIALFPDQARLLHALMSRALEAVATYEADSSADASSAGPNFPLQGQAE